MIEFKRFEKEDDEWRFLVENLWSYQWCKQAAELTPEIFDALYEHTQGVTDFLVKLLVLSQRYAIQSGSECLTAETIIKVSNSKMQILRPALSALRSRDPSRMRKFDDLLPIEEQLMEMMAFNGLGRADRLALLRGVTPASRSNATAQETVVDKITAPAAVAVEASQAKAFSEHPDTLAELKSAGWITTDIFEFSPAYRRA